MFSYPGSSQRPHPSDRGFQLPEPFYFAPYGAPFGGPCFMCDMQLLRSGFCGVHVPPPFGFGFGHRTFGSEGFDFRTGNHHSYQSPHGHPHHHARGGSRPMGPHLYRDLFLGHGEFLPHSSDVSRDLHESVDSESSDSVSSSDQAGNTSCSLRCHCGKSVPPHQHAKHYHRLMRQPNGCGTRNYGNDDKPNEQASQVPPLPFERSVHDFEAHGMRDLPGIHRRPFRHHAYQPHYPYGYRDGSFRGRGFSGRGFHARRYGYGRSRSQDWQLCVKPECHLDAEKQGDGEDRPVFETGTRCKEGQAEQVDGSVTTELIERTPIISTVSEDNTNEEERTE